jgi:hypothetical protein
MRTATLSIALTLAFAGFLPAQSPAPVIVQAATPATTSPPAPVAAEKTSSIPDALKMLREMKAANEETLRKQAATLEQLDELEKTADQIKIYARRS